MKLTRALIAIGYAAILGCAAVLIGPAPASAIATLTLNDHSNPIVTVVDGGVGDACPNAGCVTFIGSIGVWNLNVTTGVSFSPSPHIDLNSINFSTGAGVLDLAFSDIDFTSGAGAHIIDLASLIGGTTSGQVQWHSGINDANTLPGPVLLDRRRAVVGTAGVAPADAV